jgi:hypothetical protein
MLTKAFAKFIKRKRVFCEGNPCCLNEGTHVMEYKEDGGIYFVCDKHFPKTTNQKDNTCQQQP